MFLSKLQFKNRYIHTGSRPLSVLISLIIVVGLLILSGVSYRFVSSYLQKATSEAVVLDRPLKDVPSDINGWQGKDVPISLEILKVAGNDDYLNRTYFNSKQRLHCNLYIAFSARPRTMLGHRPRVCYKGAGWIHDQTEDIAIKTPKKGDIPALLHKFHKDYNEIYVLNFYILNGKITTSEAGFTGLSFRVPNIDGHIARYVAQVQISGRYASSFKLAAESFIDTIMDFFPAME